MGHHQRGLTLIELMVVVAIVGILAAVAVFAYQKYTRKAKSSEVRAMFSEFKTKQEAYHTENGEYVSTSSATPPSENDKWPWPISGNRTDIYPLPVEWDTLRMNPDSTGLYCGYVTIAGAGGDNTNLGGTKATEFGLTVAPVTNWYYVLAECDFDDDPLLNSFYMTHSHTDRVADENPGN